MAPTSHGSNIPDQFEIRVTITSIKRMNDKVGTTRARKEETSR